MGYYYWPKVKLKLLGEEVFGDKVKKMNFLYSSYSRIWYRITPNEIIQFLGLRRYSDGEFDFSFICQPLFVPIIESILDAKCGQAPSNQEESGVVLMSNMMEMDMIGFDDISAVITRKSTKDDIIKHMNRTFDVVIRPFFERSVDVMSCYEEYRKIKMIRNEYIRRHTTQQEWKKMEDMPTSSAMDIYVNIYLKNYEKASEEIMEHENRIIKLENMGRLKGVGNHSMYYSLLPMVQMQSEKDCAEFIDSNRKRNLSILEKRGFVLEF